MKTIFTLPRLLPLLALLGIGCDEQVAEPEPFAPVWADTARDVYANHAAITVLTVKDLRADTSNELLRPYAYFDLDKNVSLPATGDTSGWDLAFRATGIRVNGQYQVLSGTSFESLTMASDSGYSSSGSIGWYDYDLTTYTITPKANVILVVKTATGKYAKVQIQSYYKGNPASPVGLTDTARYYTFRYLLQANGSRDLAPNSAPVTYYSLSDGNIVTDTSKGWDLALRTTSVKINGQSQILSATEFDTLMQAPETGYGTSSTSLAWYDYSGDPNHTVTPKPATVVVIKAADGKYTKLQFLSYYKGAPLNPIGITDTSRYFTFRYFRQADGSRSLK